MDVLIFDVLYVYFPGYSEYCQSFEHCKQQCLSSLFSSSSGKIFLKVTAIYFFVTCNELTLSLDLGVHDDLVASETRCEARRSEVLSGVTPSENIVSGNCFFSGWHSVFSSATSRV